MKPPSVSLRSRSVCPTDEGGLFCRLSAPAFKQKGWGFPMRLNRPRQAKKKKIRFIEKLELLGYAKRSILLARCELRLRYSSPHKSWPEFPMPLASQFLLLSSKKNRCSKNVVKTVFWVFL